MSLKGHTPQMYLVIDQGNTLIKAAFFKGDELLWVKNYTHFDGEELTGLFNNTSVIHGIISSVSGEPGLITEQLPEVKWIVLDHNTPLPVANLYHTPESLGKDRLAGVVAAAKLHEGRDILVIDAGTAITYDLINKNKEYLGGSITPGLNIRFKGLNTFTGRLPLYTPAEFNDLTGRDTYTSIMSGVMAGTLFEMQGFISKYEEFYPGLHVVITGGDAKYFDEKLKCNIFASPNLVLIGLKLILQHNLEK